MLRIKMKIGIIGGTGKFGKELATNLAMVGHDVIIGSRKVEKAVDVVKGIEKHSYIELSLKGESNRKATDLSDIVVLSVPYETIFATIDEIIEELHQKIIITNIVPIEKYNGSFHHKPVCDSVADIIQGYVSLDNIIVAAMHTIPASYLTKADELQTFIYTNEEGILDTMFELFKSINIEPFYCGNLRKSIFAEEMTIFLLNLSILNGSKTGSLMVV